MSTLQALVNLKAILNNLLAVIYRSTATFHQSTIQTSNANTIIRTCQTIREARTAKTIIVIYSL